MQYPTEELLKKVLDYHHFFTLEELDKKAHEVSSKYNFKLQQIGNSAQGHPIYTITAGRGAKKAFVWGFPHPNEPIGSLTVDWLINYFGTHPQELEKSGYTWIFMYTADPDGTKLNEPWFKGPFTLDNYFKGYFRQQANRMIDWTFPIEYEDAKWNKPTPETQAIIHILDAEKPDVMYPLHNAGFGGAYFFGTRKLSQEYYANIRKLTSSLGIPMHNGEPEEPFMVELERPFYLDFGFKEYYDHTKKIGGDTKRLEHGDNSTNYLLKINPESFTMKSEVPYFFDEQITDTSESDKTRREVWLEFLDASATHSKHVKDLILEMVGKLQAPDPYYYLLEEYKKQLERTNDAMRKHVTESKEFDRKANKAEVFSGLLGGYFYNGGLKFGQVRRIALATGMHSQVIKQLDEKIKECAQIIEKRSNWKPIPIQKLVQFQLGFLFETLNKLI